MTTTTMRTEACKCRMRSGVSSRLVVGKVTSFRRRDHCPNASHRISSHHSEPFFSSRLVTTSHGYSTFHTSANSSIKGPSHWALVTIRHVNSFSVLDYEVLFFFLVLVLFDIPHSYTLRACHLNRSEARLSIGVLSFSNAALARVQRARSLDTMTTTTE